MRHRIRVAALVTDGDRMLLVQHVHPKTQEEWWVPPGGGLEEEDGNIFECVKREVWEETGLRVELGKIVYLREFYDNDFEAHNLEIFIEALSFSGDLTIKHIQGKGIDEHYIKDVRWVEKNDLLDLTVYPENIKDSFWDDQADGFPEVRYLGKNEG